jgi:poly-gamma-glutamate capsule biosynthesis protein CapA/YwtB (metallophosphatase superfamily)
VLSSAVSIVHICVNFNYILDASVAEHFSMPLPEPCLNLKIQVYRTLGVILMAVSIIATGDSFITQRLPRDDGGCRALKRILSKADVRFTNFEVLLHDFEISPSAVSGGTWAAARPQVLDDLKWLGLNMFAWANNHTLDWGQDGLLTTLRHLESAGCVHAGVGRDLHEASMPKYLDTAHGRVALIGVTSSVPDWHRAGAGRRDVAGRPGSNLLRFKTTHYVGREDFERLQEIINQTELNATRLQMEREGFATAEEGGFLVRDIKFEIGEPGTATAVHAQDAQRIINSVKEAAAQADVVLVSHHFHEMKGAEKDRPADFAREFARLCIDNGAHAYLGHGPHILRGIEVYRNRPIFYSLGDFIFQNDFVERQPADFFENYGLGPDSTVLDGMNARSANNTRGLGVDRRVFESVMAAFEVKEGKINRIELIPVSLGFEYEDLRKGQPYPSLQEDATRILAGLSELSVPFKTEIAIEKGRGIINI